MNNFWTWFAQSPMASALRVFVAIVIGQMVAEWARVGDIQFTNYKSWVITALVAAIPTVLRWINPQDKAFGPGKEEQNAAAVLNM
jgi:hypothetical protein